MVDYFTKYDRKWHERISSLHSNTLRTAESVALASKKSKKIIISANRRRAQLVKSVNLTTDLESLESKLTEINLQEKQEIMDLSKEMSLEVIQMELRTHIRQSLTELTDIGWKIYQNDLSYFCNDGQLNLYFKLANELSVINELHETQFSYRNDEPLLPNCSALTKRLFPRQPPQGAINDFFNERQEDIKTLVRELQRNSYITKKAAGKLTQLLKPADAELERRAVKNISLAVKEFFDQIYEATRTNIEPIRKEEPVTIETQIIETEIVIGPTTEQIAESRDVLTSFFELEESVVNDYSTQLSHGDLVYIYGQLSSTVGDDSAMAIIRNNPDVLMYMQTNQWSKYIRALNVICNGSGQEAFEKHPTSAYSSLEKALELKRKVNPFANGEDTGKITEEVTNPELNLYKYTFLHTGNEHVDKRRESLIKNGSVTVTDKDHWNGGSSGARGNNIIMKIDYEIGILFADLGLPEPTCKTNFGQRTLTISQKDQAYLTEIAIQYCK